jgi:hypothetical protein
MFPHKGLFFLKSEQNGFYLSINGEDEVKKECEIPRKGHFVN